MAQTALLVEHAKPPRGMTAADLYSTLSLAFIVELRHGVILEAGGSLITEAAKAYIRQLFVGERLLDGGAGVVAAIEAGYGGAAPARRGKMQCISFSSIIGVDCPLFLRIRVRLKRGTCRVRRESGILRQAEGAGLLFVSHRIGGGAAEEGADGRRVRRKPERGKRCG